MPTLIEWTDETWNPVTGCDRISPGCKRCYAKSLHDMRHKAHLNGKAMPKQYHEPFEHVHCWPDRLEIPLHWRAPRLCFVNSMSDLFHEDVDPFFIAEVFDVILRCPHITFQALTKRAKQLLLVMNVLAGVSKRPDYPSKMFPPPNFWPGVSVENKKYLDRIDVLRQVPAALRMVSFEPLLEDLGEVNLEGIGWAIVGGESGPGARPMRPDWARSLRDQCIAAGVPFFFKQWGEWLPAGCDGATRVLNASDCAIRVGKKKAGRQLDGREWNEFPKPYPGHQVVRLPTARPPEMIHLEEGEQVSLTEGKRTY
jgi:protein gp37